MQMPIFRWDLVEQCPFEIAIPVVETKSNSVSIASRCPYGYFIL